MTRREIRDGIFLILFRYEFYDEEGFRLQSDQFFSDLAAEKKEDEDYMRKKLDGILSKLPELDKALNERTTHWKTSRMGKVELAILRLGLYELLYEEDIPNNVAVNEAVELAKKYGTEDSFSFVNGVLAKFL
ncbi:MAG: transcription antitermination factor NusB [Lachnospiraceae bacterium]|nr:transcription antitermination factor NusB [Lachnospiraceae bacterium]MBQ7505734.1 transcription antitermination factor NusB [Lachnospiraceae bacterium]